MRDPLNRPPPAPDRVSGNLVDPLARTIRPATLTIESGRIVSIHDDAAPHATFLLPGFVDAHVTTFTLADSAWTARARSTMTHFACRLARPSPISSDRGS